MSPTPKRLLQDRLPRPLFLVLLFSLFSFLSLGSALLTSPSTHATSSSINVSITGSPVVTVTPNAEGKFASGEFAVGITTTHASGYTFSIKAAEGPNPTRLNGTTTEGFLASITSPISTDTFKNDSTYNEQWGYKPSILYNSNTKENTANDNYLPSPSTAGDTLAVTHTAGDSSYPISIGTRVTVATVEDVYSNTFVFTAIVNPTPYTLTYNANTSDSVSNMPANISDGETNGETFNISNTVPTRSGYDFKGWCTSQVADGATCPTTTYNPDGDGSNLTYTIDQTSATNNVTLYAVWGSQGGGILYDLVAAQLKTNTAACSVKTADGKCSQNAASLKAVITAPTSSDPATDTSNSGVFAYNASVFGAASDASNSHTIYYFRGVLDSNIDPSSSASPNYGSNGDSAYYQNYVRLGNTCWRIFRTTGSGGVKMIYNGSYPGGTTANSCANVTTNAQLTIGAFNASSATAGGTTYTGLENHNMHAVGYTYSNVAAGTTTNTALNILLGSSGNDTTTNVNKSIIKKYIENGWYKQKMTSYTNILESNAGYCADRTVFNDASPYTQQAESTNVIPYNTSSITKYNFGTFVRNRVANGTRTLTLSCSRGAVDLYSTTTTSGGNGQLTYPVALMSADEAALSGNGGGGRTSTSTYSSNYSYGSFLRSGSNFWLLSPSYRYFDGRAYVSYLTSGGNSSDDSITAVYGMRPVISLVSGAAATSGTGTATDPWVVNAP